MRINRVPALTLAVLLGAAPMTACGDDETAVEQAEEAELADLVVGETVTIEGEVQERIDESSFTVGEDGTLVWGADAPDVEDEDVVAVTGTVVEFLITDVETELGIDLDDDLYTPFENELTVQADSVEIVEDN